VIVDYRRQPQAGRAMPIDLNALLLAVVPSPYSPNWFHALVSSALSRYGVHTKVQSSELLAAPFY
jgi:hypothetical protein